MKIGVVGVGYVGLSTAVCFAMKFPTVAIDLEKARVSALNEGQVPIHEKGLEALLVKGLSSKRLKFSLNPGELIDADAIFIAVGTPGNQDGSIDLSQVRASCKDIGDVLKSSTKRPLVLMRSTVVPGTARRVVKPLLEDGSTKKCGTGFGLCSNPEFLREGQAIQDTLKPSRIILGSFDDFSLRSASSLYRTFYGKKPPPVLATTPEGAELIKYGSNSFLATKITFVNLLARACELFPGTDVNDVARGMGLDPRIGAQFLQAGPGFGGSCLPKDVRAFIKSLRDMGVDGSMLESVLQINEVQPEHVVALAEARSGTLLGKEVAVLGLAFKAETDDLRESRSIALLERLSQRGASIRAYDPVAMEKAKTELDYVVYSSSAKDCIKGADLAIVMTGCRQFKSLKPSDFVRLMRSPVLIDARRIYDPRAYSRGINYVGVGLGERAAL